MCAAKSALHVPVVTPGQAVEPAPGSLWPLFDCIVPAPGFALGVSCTETALESIVFLPPDAHAAVPCKPGQMSVLAARTAAQLASWLQDPAFMFDLPVAPALAGGTAFQQRVWAEIRRIPLGQTRTYAQLASTMGSAPRPVGGACGANPLPVIVPCHRVVATGGAGGFNKATTGLMLDIKHWLLRHEARQ